ncbi:MAG TPA: radical SAM protein [Candidatus Latescibacteria bacterium]|nr:radical SAM protein [Candidatus Latescibacterota bacterium]
MKVLLVNPNRMRPVVAPLALEYIVQGLRGEGIEYDILDLAFSEDPRADIARYFSGNSPAAIGVTVRNTDDCYYLSGDFVLERTKEITDEIRRHTDVPLILGGVGFSAMPEAVISYLKADFGIVGEGEEAFPRLLRALRGDGDLSEVPGLIYRTEDGLVRNPIRYIDLGERNLSHRGAVDNLRYFCEGGMAGFETKRGCDRRCIYCLDPVSKGRWVRLRPPEDVADEIERLLSMGITHFHTCDSEFNVPEFHAVAVCEELVRRGLGDKIKWYAYASPRPFSEELASLMKRAGCVGIDFGVDHGDEGMLERLGRDFGPEALEKAVGLCRRYGIVCMFDLLLGGPGETGNTLRGAIEQMLRLAPDRVGVALGVRLYPNTRLAELVVEEGFTPENPNLRGQVDDNPDWLRPVFYLSRDLGENPAEYVGGIIRGDKRFFFPSREDIRRNYNYNENQVLVEAIQRGYRGAFWDILRRLAEGEGAG